MYKTVDYSRFNKQNQTLEPIYEQMAMSPAVVDSTSVKKPTIQKQAAVDSTAVKKPTSQQPEVKKQVGQTGYIIVRPASGGNDRYLVKDGGKQIWSIDSPETYKKIATDLKISQKSIPSTDVLGKDGDSKIKATKNKLTSNDYKNTLGLSNKPKNYLSIGDKGDKVKELQKSLGIKDDGDFGPKTKAALEKFQKENGLKVDGLAGSKTMAKIEELKAKTPSQEPSKKQDSNVASTNVENKEEQKPKAKTSDEIKAERKDLRSQYREAKKSERISRRSDRKKEKLMNKKAEAEAKLKEIENEITALGESKVYNFSEFIKVSNYLSHKK